MTMNLFKLFRRKKEKVTAPVTVETTVQENITPEINERIFSDPEPPQNVQEPTSGSRLKRFLEKQYATIGYTEGYEYHSAEILEQKLKVLLAEFRQVADEAIDLRRQEVFELKKQRIDTRDLSPRLEEQLSLRIAELEANIARLELEKERSVEGEGLVMRCVHAYKEGFLRGNDCWHEIRLFAQPTGLF